MRKTITSVFALLCLTSCVAMNESTFVKFGIEYTDGKIDAESLDDYFLNSNPSYETLKNNQPDLLNHIKCVKSDYVKSKNKIQIFRFSSRDNGGLNGMTYLHLGNNYYPLGGSFGGWGVTEFVYRSDGNHSLLYYIYSCGSGIHRSYVNAFDLSNEKQYSIVGIETADAFIDYTFEISEDNSIDLYQAEIAHSYDDEGFDMFGISKERLSLEKIDSMPLTPIE